MSLTRLADSLTPSFAPLQFSGSTAGCKANKTLHFRESAFTSNSRLFRTQLRTKVHLGQALGPATDTGAEGHISSTAAVDTGEAAAGTRDAAMGLRRDANHLRNRQTPLRKP